MFDIYKSLKVDTSDPYSMGYMFWMYGPTLQWGNTNPWDPECLLITEPHKIKHILDPRAYIWLRGFSDASRDSKSGAKNFDSPTINIKKG